MTETAETRELSRLRSLQRKVDQLLERQSIKGPLSDDLHLLHDALKHTERSLCMLDEHALKLDSIASPSIRHDLRNAIGISKGYAELIKDSEYSTNTTVEKLLDQILTWSAKTITTIERGRDKAAKLNGEPTSTALSNANRRQGTILIVDDELANRELLARYIQQLGLQALSAAGAAEAYQLLQTQQIDLILLDLIMPEVSGHELLRDLKTHQQWRAIPIIVISGLSDTAEVIQCIEAGADDYLQKPFNKVMLQARLFSGLERKEWLDKERLLRLELEKNQRFIRNTFGRYLSQEIVDTLLESPDGLDMGGELKTVTILMADIRSFTTICEQLPPDKVVKLLNNYLGCMADVIMSHGGTVDEFIGDAILALFGAPVSRPDDADRAILCALAMQERIQQVNEDNLAQGLPSISMGIALNTGEVITGNIGSDKRAKYGVVGHAVNITSRIEDCSRGDEVLISEATADASSLSLKKGRSIALQPKGVKSVIDVFAVKAASPADDEANDE